MVKFSSTEVVSVSPTRSRISDRTKVFWILERLGVGAVSRSTIYLLAVRTSETSGNVDRASDVGDYVVGAQIVAASH